MAAARPKRTYYFELGYATVLKKILVLVPPEEDLPVSEIPYLRVAPDNREAIEFGLDQILNAPRARWQTPRVPTPKTRPIGKRTDHCSPDSGGP